MANNADKGAHGEQHSDDAVIIRATTAATADTVTVSGHDADREFTFILPRVWEFAGARLDVATLLELCNGPATQQLAAARALVLGILGESLGANDAIEFIARAVFGEVQDSSA